MKKFAGPLEALARATATLPEDEARLRARLAGEAAVEDLGPSLRSRTRWRMVGGFAVAGLVAAGLAFTLVPRSSGPVHATFADTGSRALTGEVATAWSGEGEASGTARAPRIRWEAGRIDVEVEPGRGIDLAVETDEAEVRVVGTRFSVDRGALGSAVRVERGTVEVRCVDGSGRRLGAGEAVTCVPVRAAPLLRRARALQAAGSPADALVAVGQALAEPDAIVRDEVLALQVALLVELGRGPEAVAAALAYLGRDGAVRTAEVARLALPAADGADRCALLRALPAEPGELAGCP